MKQNFKTYFLFAIVMLGSAQGCNSILEEHPKTVFTNAFLQTTQGFQDGINAAYSYMRFQYGNNPSLGLNIVGTDEFTWGPEPSYNQSGDNLTHKLLGSYGANITSQNGFLGVTFNRTYPIINSLNGLLQFAPTIPGLTDAQKAETMGEIRYLRAHYYYLLIAQFGAQPLDMGSGDLVFNTNAFQGYNRLVPDLLKKDFQLIIDDLTYASQNLPDARPVLQFKLSKAVALHLLSKIYLYRAYSSVTENKTADFQSAYDIAKQLIDGKGAYGTDLQSNFADVFKQGNDYNSEILFAAERIPKAQLNNGYPAKGPSDIGDLENMASSCFTSNYGQPTWRAATLWAPIDGRPFAFQRPLRKLCPTPWLLNVAFADKINDGRYHNSFRTLYTCDTQNPSGSSLYTTYVANLAGFTPSLKIGDTAFVMTDTQAKADYINNVRKPYFLAYGPNDWYNPTKYPNASVTGTVLVYPSVSKFIDVQRATFNDASGRPMPIFRLAETYLNAAEAAFQLGNVGAAVDYINQIRTRAAANPGAVAAMKITAADISLDFILDERARELCGEGGRWVDLAMRGDDVFINRIKLNTDAAPGVQTYHRLRPIPQSQLDALSVPDKTLYQNPGYTN